MWVPTSCVEDPDGVPYSWLWLDPDLAVAGIWGLNKQVEDWLTPSPYPPFSPAPAFLINKIKPCTFPKGIQNKLPGDYKKNNLLNVDNDISAASSK